MSANSTNRHKSVTVGISLPKETYEAMCKKIPKNARSRVINILLQKYLKGDVQIAITY